MSSIRQQRISALLFEELSVLISGELRDPDVSMVHVINVTISRDLRNAKVYVTHDDTEVEPGQVLRGLKRAAPFLRAEVASRCGLRSVPEILFYYDDTPHRAARIDQLLRQISTEHPHSDNDSPPPQPATGDPTA